MDASTILRGLAIGFTIAAAVGPISLLAIRRTLAHGPGYGLVSGLGVALADATYAAVAAFGLTTVGSILVGGRLALGLAGGAFLVWLGVRTMTSRPTEAAEPVDRPGAAAAFGSMFGLTLTNPMTILSFGGIFAGLGLAGRSATDAALLTAGVFLGSTLWWVVLAVVVGRLRSRLTRRILAWINRISGGVIVVFGLAALSGTAVALLGTK